MVTLRVILPLSLPDNPRAGTLPVSTPLPVQAPTTTVCPPISKPLVILRSFYPPHPHLYLFANPPFSTGSAGQATTDCWEGDSTRDEFGEVMAETVVGAAAPGDGAPFSGGEALAPEVVGTRPVNLWVRSCRSCPKRPRRSHVRYRRVSLLDRSRVKFPRDRGGRISCLHFLIQSLSRERQASTRRSTHTGDPLYACISNFPRKNKIAPFAIMAVHRAYYTGLREAEKA